MDPDMNYFNDYCVYMSTIYGDFRQISIYHGAGRKIKVPGSLFNHLFKILQQVSFTIILANIFDNYILTLM